MKLYTVDFSPFGGRCRMAIYFKGLRDQFEFLAPETPLNDPAWRKVNPIGKLPALDTGERILVESEVILEYLEDRFPDKPLRPRNLEDRALARLLNRIADLYIFEPLFALFRQFSPENRDQAVVDASLARLHDGLTRLDAFLPGGEGPFALGASPSTADCALVTTLFFVDRMLPAFGVSDPIGHHPKVDRYWRAMNEEPTGAKVIAELQRGLDAFQRTGNPAASVESNG